MTNTNSISTFSAHYRDLHKDEENLPIDPYGNRAFYGYYYDNEGKGGPIHSVANWDQYFRDWDDIGIEYKANIPRNEPMTRQQKLFMDRNGFTGWRLIGKGGFAKVFAVHVSKLMRPDGKFITDKDLACKVMYLTDFKTQYNTVKQAISEMLAECELHQQLIHPNIVENAAVLHVDDTKTGFPSTLVCHFMELCEGNLVSLIKAAQFGRMTENQAHQWFVQVCRGLQFLHSKNCVHLDVKPENILYISDTNSGSKTFKLCDFGLSKMLKFGEQTTFYARVGSPIYMAPELLGQDIIPDVKPCDIWSLGICLAESVTGMGKFAGLVASARKWTQQTQSQYRISQRFAELLKGMCDPMPASRKKMNIILVDPWVLHKAS